MLSFLISTIKVIAVLGILVFIHELGHFTIAKLCKIRVNKFALGFGPYLFKKQKGETEYSLRLVPFGGFVLLEGEEENSEKEDSYNNASIPKRIAVLIAGGTVNIIFAVILFFCLGLVTENIVSTQIKEISEEYPLAIQSGLQSGDKIIKINNKAIHTKMGLDYQISQSNGNELDVLVDRNGEKINILLKPTQVKERYIGITLLEENIIDIVQKGDPADKAGIKTGDKILSINGEPVGQELSKTAGLIIDSETEIIKLVIERNNDIMVIDVEPETDISYRIGIILEKVDNTFKNKVAASFWNTGDLIVSSIESIKMLFTGKVKLNQMMGPIGISDTVSKTSGIYQFFNILALISFSLGLTNLLPFPPLDGGRIVMHLIEAIIRKPLNKKIETGVQMVGWCLIIMLAIVISYNDIIRIFRA